MSNFFAPQVAKWHGQQFAVMIEGDLFELLTLVVRNKDESWKKLPYSMKIKKADPVKYDWQVQTHYESVVKEDTQIPIRVWDKKGHKAYDKQEEHKLLINEIAAFLLDHELKTLFPNNKFVQYAE